jgi:hypothetical protein
MPVRMLRARPSERENGRGAQGNWPGWAGRRRKARGYFAGVSIGALLFALTFRLMFAHYRDVHVQLTLLQLCVIAVVALWFVPALVRDFDASLERPGLRLRPGMVSASLGGLFGNIMYLSFLASFALLPLALMFPFNQVVGGRYYGEDFTLFWGFHVVVFSFVMASYLVLLLGAGTALLLIIRSVAVYRVAALVFLASSITGTAVVVNALVAGGLRGLARAIQVPYVEIQSAGGYPSRVESFAYAIDHGTFLLSVIHSIWLRILLQTLINFILAMILVFVLLGLASLARVGTDLALRSFGWLPRLRRGMPTAPPEWALVISLALLGAAALTLLYNASFLQGEEMARVQAGTPFALLWLGVAAAAGYTITACWFYTVRTVGTGLGGGLRQLLAGYTRRASAYAGCAVLAGFFHLSVLARVEQRPWTEVLAAAAAMAALVLGMLALGAALLVLWRLREEPARKYARTVQGLIVGFTAGVVSYVSFLLDPPARLFGSSIAPAEAAPRIAAEAARLGQFTYTSVFHAWTGGLSRTLAGEGTGIVAVGVTVALVAAAAAVLACSLRLSRRIV